MAGADQALELFLDALCNAFGGIIFISLLVCVMLQLSGKSAEPTPVDQVAQARQQAELARLNQEIAKLEALIENQNRQLESTSKAENPQLQEQFISLTQQEAKLREQNTTLTREQRELASAITSKQQALRLQQHERDRLEQEKQELQQKVKELPERAKTTLNVPTERQTKKKQIPVTIYQGHLAFVCAYDGQGRQVGVNTRDLTFGGTEANPQISPKPGHGIAYETVESLQQQFSGKLAQFTAKPGGGKREEDCAYFMIALWPDSFKQFELLRDFLLRGGFEYGLMFMEPGDVITTGDGGGPL